MVLENSEISRSHLIDFDIDKLLLDVNSSIDQALSAIENGKERLCLLVDENRQLVKVISDGDIRRALLRGFALSDKVRLVHDRKPITAKSDNLEHMSKMLSSKITIIPVLGARSEVIGTIRLQDIGYASNIRQKSVAMIGLGYVGLTLALVLADNGFLVFGYDSDPEITRKLSNCEPTFYEKGMQNLIDNHVNNNLIIHTNKNDFEADIYVITVGTPIFRETLKPNVAHIQSALEVVAGKLKVNDLVILRSTLPVGFTRDTVIPEIERISGLKVGEEFFIAFCPERTSEGQALEELRTLPQIVGGFDENSRQIATSFFNENTHTIVDVGSLEGAEFCKLMDNTYRDTIFAYANQMAALAEVLELNASDLISKVNLGYKRNSIPLPSPGVGGPCLSKDPYILIDTFARHGLNSPLIKASREVNESAPHHIYKKCENLLAHFEKNIIEIKIFLIGLAFKGNPETSDLRDSTSLLIADYFRKMGATKRMYAYDPVVNETELEKKGFIPCTIEKGFKEASLVMILNNHISFTNLNLTSLVPTMNQPGIFFDGWNLFSPNDLVTNSGIYYMSTGTRVPYV